MVTGSFGQRIRWSFIGCFIILAGFTTGCVNVVKCTKERVDQDLTGANRGYIMGQVPEAEQSSEPKIMTYYKVDITLPPERGDVEKVPRRDQELSGNRGYMTGGPNQAGPVKRPVFEAGRGKKEFLPPPKKMERRDKPPSQAVRTEMPAQGERTPLTSPVKGLSLGEMEPAVSRPPASTLRETEIVSPQPETKRIKAEVSSGVPKPDSITAEKATGLPVVSVAVPARGAGGGPEDRPLTNYKVEKDDTLESIAAKIYGNKKKWSLIYKANKNNLKSPDKIYPGQDLIIPQD